MLKVLKVLEDIKKISPKEVEGFTNLYFNVFDLLDNNLEKGIFDRYRVLTECTKAVTDEEKDYKKDISEILKGIIECLDEYLKGRNIWTIFNYYSIFLDKRLNALKLPGNETKVKELSTDALSWYGIFGTLNRNSVLKLVKNNSSIQPNSIIVPSESNQFILYIPEGEGFIDGKDDKYTDIYCKSFVAALTEKDIVDIDGTPSTYLADSDGAKLLKKDGNFHLIAQTLFAPKNMMGWDKECLIYSNKFDTDFADSLKYFPNFLFFKRTGDFSTNDIALCKHVNWLCVKVSTRMLIFENDLLLDRLEDLVDSKPNRIFDKLSPDPNDPDKKRKIVDTTNESSIYIEEVRTVFESFINDHLKGYHSIIRNDLVIAFYLYWTQVFGEGYLNIKPCFDATMIGTQYDAWEAHYETELNRLGKKHKDKYFDFKQFIFDSRGEKYPIEFERTVANKIIDDIHNSKGVISEFEKIYICNVDDKSLDEHMKLEYKTYIEEKLLLILDNMCVQDSKFKSTLQAIIKDGTSPSDYFSIFCHDSLVSTGYKYIYYIPSVNYDQNSAGGFSFFCRNKWPRSVTKAAQSWATRFGTAFSEIEAKKLIKRETDKHGTKSAIISIDVRNLSHNIGSHVLAYWIQELNALLQDSPNDNNKLREAIRNAKAVFRYIQHRADFLAEVATSIPCSEVPFDIKKDILNPFIKDRDPGNPYKKYGPNEDGIKLDSNVYVLLRYIADSEKIAINFANANKNKKLIEYSFLSTLSPHVSIPSGIIGKHAIYSILENFIRNAAKHYKGENKDIKFMRIKVSDPDTTKAWKNDYFAVEIIDVRDNSCNCDIVTKLNDFIKGSFVDDKGELRPGGWGIKEMLVSANFLRKNSPEDLYDIITERKDCQPPLLEIICEPQYSNVTCKKPCCKTCSTSNNLTVRFYLKKPKHLAVLNINNRCIGGKEFAIDKINIVDGQHATNNMLYYRNRPIPHNILLIASNDNKITYEDDSLFPCRVTIHDDSMESIDDNYYLRLYEKFIKEEICGNINYELPKLINNLQEEYQFAATKYSDGNLTQNNASNNIIFVNHPEYQDETAKACNIVYFEKGLYFQPMSGGFSTKAKFFQNKSFPPNIRNHFYLEFIESALTKVVIVDERISEWANQESKYFDKKVREILKKMNVYVVEINKENITYKALKTKVSIENLGCKVLATDRIDNAHFFVIHQGILDKLDNANFLDEIKCRWKVIDSGRGVPQNLKERFVQISALQTLLENYDKHGLVQTLFSLRKPEDRRTNES